MDRWHDRRIALVGDDAHASLPYLSQSASQALEDGYVVGRCLDDCDTVSAAFERYQRNRNWGADYVHETARWTARLLNVASLPARLVRNTLTRPYTVAVPAPTGARRTAVALTARPTATDNTHPADRPGVNLGVVGLGRMGRIVTERLLAADHDVVAYDVDPEATATAAEAGAAPADSLADLCDRVAAGGETDAVVVWLMVPAGDAVDATLEKLEPHLSDEDVVVDGGNSHFEDSVRRAEATDAAYLDCGTSGGPAGAELGFSLMVGGPEWAYERLEPVFDAVATGPDGHDRMGPSGAGHYVKMVHNGVEYALMQAYGEGFELLHRGRYDLDLEAVARTWNNGAVIRSWLLELCAEAFREEGTDLGDVADHVAGGSTGTWTVQEALEREVPVPLIHQALAERFGSREDRFARRLANRLRYGFGRHEVRRRE